MRPQIIANERHTKFSAKALAEQPVGARKLCRAKRFSDREQPVSNQIVRPEVA